MVAGIEAQPLQPGPRLALGVSETRDALAGGREPVSELVADPLELTEVEQPRRSAACGGGPYEGRWRVGADREHLDERRRQLALEPRDLRPQRGARGPLRGLGRRAVDALRRAREQLGCLEHLVATPVHW